MRIGLINLITKTSEDLPSPIPWRKGPNLAPERDSDLNIVKMGRTISLKGHDVRVIVSDAFKPNKPMTASGNLEVIYLPTRFQSVFPPSLAPLTPSLTKLLKEEGFDVIQSAEWFQPGTALSWLGLRGSDTRFFIWQELDILMRAPLGYFQQAYYRTFGKAMTKGRVLFIPRSLSARDHLIRQGVGEENISQVVHSGVDTRLFRPLDRQFCRNLFSLQANNEIILAVGRSHPNKGHDILVNSMIKVLAEHPNALLLIKGTGKMIEQLKTLVRHLGIERNVRIISESLTPEEMAALYNCADIFVVSSRVDLFPFAAIESISCGVPVATSFKRGLKTDIVDEGAGFVLPSDPGEMGRSLSSLLSDKRLLAQRGKVGRNLALESFDFEISAKRLLEIYGST